MNFVHRTAKMAVCLLLLDFARGDMSGEAKKQSVRTKQVTDYSAKFGDFASSSLQLFSIWSKVFAFL